MAKTAPNPRQVYKMAKAKAAPVESDIVVGSLVVFQGYPEDTPEEERVLEEGSTYEVVQLPTEEDGEETGFILKAPNPDFNAKRKVDAVKNPEFLEVEVFEEEIELAESEEEEEEEITLEYLQGLDKNGLLEVASKEQIKLTAAQKKTAKSLLEAVVAALDLGGEEEQEEQEEEGEEVEDQPITIEELEGMSKADLISLAKDEGIKLSVAQKKTKDTLIDAIAEALDLEDGEAEEAEEKEEEAPAKPAAKTKTKAAAKAATEKATTKATDKQAAKAKAPAKAATKAKAPAKAEEAEEELPDLENEDAEVLALVNDSDNLIELAQDLENNVGVTEYRLGGVLYHIKKDGAYKDIDPEYKEKGGWALFLKDHFNIGYRKAQHLLEIYIVFTQAGIENPSEAVARIGWTKASKLCKPMEQEDADIDALMEAAENNTVEDLSAIIKETYTEGGTSEPGKSIARITLKFRYEEEQAQLMETVLKEAADRFGCKADEALMQIVLDWASTEGIAGGGKVAKVKDDQAPATGKKETAKARASSRAR